MPPVIMRAVRIHEYGGPEALRYEENVPMPEAGAGEVLIRVYAAGVNPLDWKVREGRLSDRIAHRLPLIPGWDVSGVVEVVAAEVRDFVVGDEVFACLDTGRDGAYAEYAVARTRILARKPRSIDYIQAASVPLAGLTAWQCLFDTGGLTRGQKVLIHGAAGSVGSFAVQCAKQEGAYVIAAVMAEDRAYVESLGADEVVAYDAGPFEKAVSNVDLVLNVFDGEIQGRSLAVIKKGGILVSTVRIDVAEKAAQLGIKTKPFFVQPNAAQLTGIAFLIDSGRVKPNVGPVLPLEKAREAQELAKSGKAKGKVVLKIV